MSASTKASRLLSFVLRHKPEDFGIELEGQGWTDVEALLVAFNQRGIALTRPLLDNIVAQDGKGRYSYSEDGHRIRANQGHSTRAVQLEFTAAEPPSKLYHGTTEAALAQILLDGLLPMSRQLVHLSASRDTAAQVAHRRKGPHVILEIDTRAMEADGLQFFLSTNNVWLVRAVPAKYLAVVT